MAPEREAVHVPEAFVADSAVSPLRKFAALTETLEIVSELLSPDAVLFHVGTAVSPFLNAPDVPLAPVTEMFAADTVGTIVSTVASVVSVPVRLLDAASVAVTETLLFASSIASEPRIV